MPNEISFEVALALSQLPAVVQREKLRAPGEECSPVVRIQKMIFEEAAAMDASDIHIEPSQGTTRVRYRIDGLLRNALEIPRWMHENLVVRIKVLAKLDISERRVPQDGHITAEESNGLDIRVSVLPTRWGEKIIIRMLRRGRSLMTLAQLGFQAAVEDRLHGLIRRPQGMLLAVGPTGSGKTTTLYAFVNEIRREPMNIVTIEDPVEYEVDGVSQVPVNEKTGLTFSKALRSILRQDPDVIVGRSATGIRLGWRFMPLLPDTSSWRRFMRQMQSRRCCDWPNWASTARFWPPLSSELSRSVLSA
jgi:type II secretory ATPase GspE/PulE/Tfp pilus assembly ATPase PilB-like protein